MPKKAKKATVGTKIALEYCKFPDGRIVYGPVWSEKLSRRIDAAVRGEGKLAFMRGRMFAECATPGKCDKCRENAAKYGVRL